MELKTDSKTANLSILAEELLNFFLSDDRYEESSLRINIIHALWAIYNGRFDIAMSDFHSLKEYKIK